MKINFKNKSNKKGFTLIELLVVVAIIGVLAAIVIINLDLSQAKARDSRRISDLSTISKAFQLYYEKNDTYKIGGTGNKTDDTIVPIGNGDGWFNFSGGTSYSVTSINQGLITAGLLSGVVQDPSGETYNSGTHGNQEGYLFYFSDNVKASVFAMLESTLTDEQSATYTNSCKSLLPCRPTSYPVTDYHMNYAATIIP